MTVARCWFAGTNTMVVTIPQNVRKVYKLNDGSYIEFEVKKVYNNVEIDKEGNSKLRIKIGGEE